MTWKERERVFYIGAPLAIVPALGFLLPSCSWWWSPKSPNAPSFGALLVLLIIASYRGLFLALITVRI